MDLFGFPRAKFIKIDFLSVVFIMVFEAVHLGFSWGLPGMMGFCPRTPQGDGVLPQSPHLKLSGVFGILAQKPHLVLSGVLYGLPGGFSGFAPDALSRAFWESINYQLNLNYLFSN